MRCANCRREDDPAYTLRAHVEQEGGTDDRETATDGGESPVVDLRFCSFDCLREWT
jgi:hypothetical protein